MTDNQRITGLDVVRTILLINSKSESMRLNIISSLLSEICLPESEDAARKVVDDASRALSRCMEGGK